MTLTYHLPGLIEMPAAELARFLVDVVMPASVETPDGYRLEVAAAGLAHVLNGVRQDGATMRQLADGRLLIEWRAMLYRRHENGYRLASPKGRMVAYARLGEYGGRTRVEVAVDSENLRPFLNAVLEGLSELPEVAELLREQPLVKSKNRGGRPRNADDVWAWRQVNEKGRPAHDVKPEWIARIGERWRVAIDPERMWRTAIEASRRKPEETE